MRPVVKHLTDEYKVHYKNGLVRLILILILILLCDTMRSDQIRSDQIRSGTVAVAVAVAVVLLLLFRIIPLHYYSLLI